MDHTTNTEMPDTEEQAMVSRRITGTCALLGGASMIAHSVLMAVSPPGLPDGPYRDGGTIAGMFFLGAVVFISAAAIGIYWIHGRGRGATAVVRISTVTAAASLFFGVALFNAAYLAGFVLILIAVAAFTATGIGLLQTQVLPRWTGGLLAVSSVLLLATNTEDSRVLFLVPFGATWVTIGAVSLIMASHHRFTRATPLRYT
ncbi:hypothetical protein ACIPY2_21075 [Paenarthrobacter sp. NPDC089675]|uniref:hypothetical protein n=1 Tax=Paenarthrobacter sp. NPDC089675 TaxID=3364376 RepID=UPI003822A220